MTGEPFRILTVCIGNVCRSPVAERLLRHHLAEHVERGTLVVESAGVGALVGREVEPAAAQQLARLGGSGAGFVARQVTDRLLGEADLVLTATTDIRARALREVPSALKRTFTLGEFATICEGGDESAATTPLDLVGYATMHRTLAAGLDLDVPDPMGRDESVHQVIADQIDAYVTVIAARLGPLLTHA